MRFLFCVVAIAALLGGASLGECFVRGFRPASPRAAAVPYSLEAPSSGQVKGAAPLASSAAALRGRRGSVLRAAGEADGSAGAPFDVAVVGLGVGGHAACLHAKALGMRVAAVSGGDPGGTCVNRGCIPSKALLAAARRVRLLQDTSLLQQMGIHLQGKVRLDPRQAGDYALGVASKVREETLR